MPIRVLIADDHPIVRSGVRGELAARTDITVIGEATNGDETVRLVDSLLPDVLVLDIQMPGLHALKVIHYVRAISTPVRVLIMTAHGDYGTAHDMLEAGATGYLLKDEAPEAIVDAILAVAAGRRWLSNDVAQTLAHHLVENTPPPISVKLSMRELEVLRLAADGRTNPEIGAILNIGEKAVQKRLTGVYQKLGVASRVEAVVTAIQQGLLAAQS